MFLGERLVVPGVHEQDVRHRTPSMADWLTSRHRS